MGLMQAPSFYDTLTPMREPGLIFDSRFYVPVPSSWYLAVSDIKGSTAAVETGQHSDVNFAAAAMIAALNNLCEGIPYQFGGDGAVALIPPEHAVAARRVLAQTRRFAREEFKLDLRVGLAPMEAIAARGGEVFVGRYEPAPFSAYAVFLGDGVDLMESSVKGRADDSLAALAMIGDADDDGEPPNLTGLSCRWTPLKAARGKMVALVIRGPNHGTLHGELTREAGVPALNAASLESLQARWPPKGLVREARARRRNKPLFVSTILVALETFVAYLFVKYKWKLGSFSAEQYRRDVLRGAVDFARSGASLALVFDCPVEHIERVRGYLETRARNGELTYGMHVSDHAVMTCLVTSAADKHVHFVDGGDGGYTRAATALKARLTLPQ
jgi:hypothetical protein